MVIQAQYPSNLVHVQEGKIPFGGSGGGGGLFADQTNMLFNYAAVGTNQSRKRRRETDGGTTTIAQALESSLMATQQPHTSPNNVVSTGLGLAFYDHQQPPQHAQPQLHSISPQCSTHSSVQQLQFLHGLDPYIKQHRNEIEYLFLAQSEQLQRALTEKRERHYRTLLNAADEILSKRLKEKEVEAAKAVRQHTDLLAKANHLTLEAQAWQARAKMQENYAVTLQSQLQQAIIGRWQGGTYVENGDVYGGEGNNAGVVSVGEAEDAESAYIDPDRVVFSGGPICKSCRKRDASTVLLPCRHLCLCTECDAIAQACPACLTVRGSSIEVIFS